ncbi:hypothetical protein [Streptomyces sp. I5]|uniref:hypothetical protein n=1 Tax=Streptomyces sp. I5 TaxID=2759947 RepID=UPI0018EE626A|nr:hypothetical protein [Streptomyces sp. I5]MBJ6633377.1 hypothetical protein [Streptomyces sp. I5]
MRAAARRQRKRLGRRGTFLVFMGAGKMCFGASFIFDPPATTGGFALLTRFAPLHCWAWLWIVCGAAAFCSAWVRFGRDGWGFVAASIPPALWAWAYGWAGLTGDYSRGLFLFGWYLTSHCGVIWCASRVPPDAGSPGHLGQAAEGRSG